MSDSILVLMVCLLEFSGAEGSHVNQPHMDGAEGKEEK